MFLLRWIRTLNLTLTPTQANQKANPNQSYKIFLSWRRNWAKLASFKNYWAELSWAGFLQKNLAELKIAELIWAELSSASSDGSVQLVQKNCNTNPNPTTKYKIFIFETISKQRKQDKSLVEAGCSSKCNVGPSIAEFMNVSIIYSLIVIIVIVIITTSFFCTRTC